MTTTGKLIGMIKFIVWCSRVLAGASNDFEKRSLEGSERRLLRRMRRGVWFLRRSGQACTSARAPIAVWKTGQLRLGTRRTGIENYEYPS